MQDQTRRQFIQTSLAAGATWSDGALFAQAAAKRPNVLLIVTDDQGAHLSCLGTRGIRTLHMDRLAREGALFTNAFATCASCSPARSAILTGMTPHSNGHWRNTVGPRLNEPDEQFGRRSTKVDKVGVHEDVPTLVELLNAGGYVTGITQKFHLSPPWKFPFHERLPLAHTPAPNRAAALAFFRQSGARPFFLMANVGNTHRPFPPHIFEKEKYAVDPAGIDVPANLPDTPKMRRDLAHYFTTVQCADAVVGALLEALRESGKRENTLVIFTSDQGYAYHRAKASVYDAGIRVPLICAGPGIQAKQKNAGLVSHVDLAPTILDYAGLAAPKAVQGESLRGVLAGKAASTARRFVFAEHNSHGPNPAEHYPVRSACDGRLHYLRNLWPEKRYVLPADLEQSGKPWHTPSYEAVVEAREEFPLPYQLLQQTHQRPPEELYDLRHDPHETRNLIADKRYVSQLATLREALNDWMKRTHDPGDPQKLVRRE